MGGAGVEIRSLEALGERHDRRVGRTNVEGVNFHEPLVPNLTLSGDEHQPATVLGQVRLELPVRVVGSLVELAVTGLGRP